MTSVSKIAIKAFIGVFACVINICTPIAAFALNPADYPLQRIDNYHRDAVACPTGTTSASGAALIGDDNKTKIWNFLRGFDKKIPAGRELNEEQAAGLMGNIRQEAGSDFSPSATESGGGGYGIVQWTGTRRTALEKAAKDKGVAVSDLAFQLDYLYQESNLRKVSSKVADQGYGTQGANEWTTMQQQIAKEIDHKPRTGIENATVFWHNNFEVSADTPDFVLNQRGAFSLEVYQAFTGKPAPAASSGSGSGSVCISASGGGDLATLTIKYAWPKYHPKPWTDLMPDYKTAIDKAIAAGQYVGGIQYEGVDCGGFVTRLMIDSGFEPNYNYAGKSSDGAGATPTQEKWLQANWTSLGNAGGIDTSTLRPGDVAMKSGEGVVGHTFVYVGKIETPDGTHFDNRVVASASLDGRAPMAGAESITDSDFTWYRKK